MDCQSRGIRSKEISWEMIPLLQAEGNESLNYDNVSRDGGEVKRTLRKKTARFDRIDMKLGDREMDTHIFRKRNH